MTSETVLDLAALAVIRSLQQPGAEDLVRKIVDMFVEDSELYGSVIGQAIQDANTDHLGAAAHSLKSCAANVGAIEVAEMAAKLEMLGRNKSLDGADQLHVALQSALVAARCALLAHVASDNAEA
jgi:HPt (histidine-containing phosphotransfer) domain-containing protein